MRTDFVAVTVISDKGTESIQFVNQIHIQRVYEEKENIIIELTDYTTLKVKSDNIYAFMDRFVRQ
jgi:hypothetical protein